MRITEIPLLQEIKEEYLELRSTGNNRTDAVREMQQRYRNELQYGAEDDGLLFWIGLADAQCSVKELALDIAEKATAALQQLLTMDWEISPNDIFRRARRYQQAPQPEKIFGKPRGKYRCSWEIGDTFAYKLPVNNIRSEDSSRYIILRKVDAIEFGDGSLYPAVTLTLWSNSLLPQTAEEFSSVPLLRLNKKRMLLPTGAFEYRAELIIKSRKQLSSVPFLYLGRFIDILSPADEGIIDDPGKMTMLHLDCLDRDLPLFIKCSRLYEEETRKANHS